MPPKKKRPRDDDSEMDHKHTEEPAPKKNKHTITLDDDTDDEGGESPRERTLARPARVTLPPAQGSATYTFTSAKGGFDNYKKPQRKEWNYHSTAQAFVDPATGDVVSARASGTSLEVPPLHSRWPSEIFRGKMSFLKWLQELAKSEEALDVLKYEINFESNVLSAIQKENQLKNKKFYPNFMRNRMQWVGWSGMLQLEISFPKQMLGCQGFLTCLQMMIKDHFSEKGALKKSDAKEFSTHLQQFLTALKVITDHILKDVRTIRVSPLVSFIHKKVHETIGKSWAFRQFNGKTDELVAVARLQLPTISPLKLPKDVQAKEKELMRGRVTRALKKPQEIHEVTITLGVRKLFRLLWPDGDTSRALNFEVGPTGKLGDRVCAALCLLELMCGSRQLGILMVNWFQRVDSKSMVDWEGEHEEGKYESLEQLASYFGRTQKCVLVSRLSKEQSPEAQAAKANRMMEGEEKKLTPADIKQRVIVKPINYMFVDANFLNTSSGATHTTQKEGMDVFLRLVTAVRASLRERKPDVLTVRKHGMWGLADKDVYKMSNEIRNVAASWTLQVIEFARKTFVTSDGKTMFRENQGTHLFRKIYMNWSYNAFASTKMKETGYASAVLGHRGFQVSLNYTSLIITPALSAKLTDTGHLNLVFAEIRARLAKLEGKEVEVVQNPDEATFWVDGDMVTIKKLKLKHNTSGEERILKSLEHLREMKDKGIPLTVRNQRLAGITSSTRLRADMTSRPEYDELINE